LPDQIKIEELKLFVGTGLKVLYRDKKEHELTGISGGLAVLGKGENWFYADLTNIKPIFRPWSHLNKEIEHNGEKFTPWVRRACWGALEPEFFDADKDDLGFEEALELASWHFDIFNWLNRTGPDGEPLAVEMESDHG